MTFHSRICLLTCTLMGCSSSVQTRPVTLTLVNYEAPQSGTKYYSTQSVGIKTSPTGQDRQLHRSIEKAAKRQAKTLLPDDRLDELANWILENLDSSGRIPPVEAIDYATHTLGIPEPSPHVMLLGLSDVVNLELDIEERIAEILSSHSYTHYGSTIRKQEGMYRLVIVFTWRWFQMSRVPRSIASGTPLRIKGKLTHGLQHPRIVLTKPDGQIEQKKSDTAIRFNIPINTGRSGVYRIELLAQGSHGPTVLANFPIYVDVPIPHELSSKVSSKFDGSLDASEFAEQLLALINQTRSKAGLRTLKEHEGVSKVANAHCIDMQENGFIGHTSPTTGEPAHRIKKAGILTDIVLENIGRGYSPEEVHSGLMRSPAHSANLLSPEVTHIGIGIVRQSDGKESQKTPAYLVTEVFIRIVATIDSSEAVDDILEIINQAREKVDVSAVSMSHLLSETAQRTASDYFKKPNLSESELVVQANRRLGKKVSQFKRIGTLFKLVSSLDQISDVKQLLDPDITEVGIGIAQGTKKGSIPNAVAVVIIMAWSR